MTRMAKSVNVIPMPMHSWQLFVDTDEFPWFTEPGSIKSEPVLIERPDKSIVEVDGASWVTVKFLVDGPVNVPDEYYSDCPRLVE